MNVAAKNNSTNNYHREIDLMCQQVRNDKLYLDTFGRMLSLTAYSVNSDFHKNIDSLSDKLSATSRSMKMFSLSIDLVMIIAKMNCWGNEGSNLMKVYQQMTSEVIEECEPLGDIVEGVFKRTIRFLRDEFLRLSDLCDSSEFPMALRMQIAKQYADLSCAAQRNDILENLLSSLDEVKTDLEAWDDQKRARAVGSFFQDNDSICLLGFSIAAIRLFLDKCNEQRIHLKVRIMIPTLEIDDASILSALNKLEQISNGRIQWSIVHFRNMFTLMQSRYINKIVMNAKTVYRDGSFRCVAGANLLSTLASAYKIPIVMIAGLHKLCSIHLEREYRLTDEMPACELNQTAALHCPQLVYRNQQSLLINTFDIVNSESVTHLLTNSGLIDPKRIYTYASDVFCKFEAFIN
ncbi:hypothetical protein ACOME3_007915 [Neoechinorhynchus agilis]